MATVFGAGHHQGQVQSDDALITQQFRNIARGDLLGQSFDDGGFAHSRFAEQHRIVFGAAAEDLDDTLDFVLAANDRVHLAFAGDFRQVAAKGFERRSLNLPLFLRRRFFGRFAGAGFLCGGQIGVEFFQDFVAGLFDIDIEVFEDARSDAVAFPEQAQEDVFGADVGMVEVFGFFAGQRQHLLHAWGVGDIADHFLVGTGADLFFDFHAYGLQIEAKFLEDIDGDPLAQFNQAQQEVLGAHKIMIEAVGFLARQGQHLLRAGREIIHGFVAHTLKCNYFSGLSTPVLC